MSDKRINYSDIPPIPAKWFKTARRATPQETEVARKAIEHETGVPRPVRLGRRPGNPADRYIPTYIKLHPRVVAWARARAKRLGIGYQTVINQTLLHQAA